MIRLFHVYFSERQFDRLSHFGNMDQLSVLLEQYEVDRAIIAMENRRGRLPVGQLLQAKERGVIVDDGPDFYEAVAGRVHLDSSVRVFDYD